MKTIELEDVMALVESAINPPAALVKSALDTKEEETRVVERDLKRLIESCREVITDFDRWPREDRSGVSIAALSRRVEHIANQYPNLFETE